MRRVKMKDIVIAFEIKRQRLKTIFYIYIHIYRLLYQSLIRKSSKKKLILTANQKSTIDTHTYKRKK